MRCAQRGTVRYDTVWIVLLVPAGVVGKCRFLSVYARSLNDRKEQSRAKSEQTTVTHVL